MKLQKYELKTSITAPCKSLLHISLRTDFARFVQNIEKRKISSISFATFHLTIPS